MDLKRVYCYKKFKLWIEPSNSFEKLEEGIGHIEADSELGSYYLAINEKRFRVHLIDNGAAGDLNFYLGRHPARLAQITNVAKNGHGLLVVCLFSSKVVHVSDIEVGIDDHIKHTAKSKGINFKTTADLTDLLEERCMIRIGEESYFTMVSGPAADKDFETIISGEPETEEADKEEQETDDIEGVEPGEVEQKYRAFSILGEGVRIPVEKRRIDDLKEIFFASKAIFSNRKHQDKTTLLVKGDLQFCDYTKTGVIKNMVEGALGRIINQENSYLKKWDEYGAVEGELLLNRAKAVGEISYHSAQKTENGVKFFAKSIPDELTEGDQIEITEDLPNYLKDTEMTWDEYDKQLKLSIKHGDSTEFRIGFIEILDISKESIELKLDEIPDKSLHIILSITGDEIQIKRRMKAREAVISGTCAYPSLGLILEEEGILPDIQRVSKLKPLTHFVRNKVFKFEPTPRQIEAIDVALNTPDIALIQGPPGTGKTTIITAILERLNEEYDKQKSIKGKVLVSGFQHDAVENIVSRLSINSLPAIKFGSRFTMSDFSADATRQRMAIWCAEIADSIRNRNPEIQNSEEQRHLSEKFISYSLSPSESNTRSLLEDILQLPVAGLPSELASEARRILDSLKVDERQIDNETLRKIRSLRVTQDGYKDDGPERALEVLLSLKSELTESEIDLLERASYWDKSRPPDFLLDLQQLRKGLLYRSLLPPEYKIQKPRSDVTRLVAKISQYLRENKTHDSEKAAVVAEFLHELENNPDGVRLTMEDYNFVYAATTQQSEGGEIRIAKKRFGDDLIYDTVIVDEAARTSPRDLLIPMVQAEKRIILVGDHRQLPHVIDDEIARMYEDGKNGSGEFIRQSMFEYLFERLKKLENQDGIKRTVTLDAQFRCHPLLGNFLSENFYEKHDETFSSPLEANHFEQNLQDIGGKSAIWINVPNERGQELRLPSKSRKRDAEAHKIAEYIDKWINSEEGEGYTFGVISFYKAQVYAIFEALKPYGITQRTTDGQWEITPEYSNFDDGNERLRIGTVDSFQGMEFDIVLLSMVRSIKPGKQSKLERQETLDKKKIRSVFGHLMSENRLCVSMSRQKKVLAVVGDQQLADSNIGREYVPALNRYSRLCRERGVIL